MHHVHRLSLLALLLAGCGAQPAPTPAAPPAEEARAAGLRTDHTPIQALAAEILAAHDHNRDGAITFGRTEKQSSGSELYRLVERSDDRPDQRPYTVRRLLYTRKTLFYAADVNGDMRVPRSEIVQLISRFDLDRDGALSRKTWLGWATLKPAQELERFKAAYGEQLVSDVTQTVSP